MEDNREDRMSLPMRDSVILMGLIILELVICVRNGLALNIPLLFSWLIMYLYAIVAKRNWHEIEGYALDAVRSGFQSIMIVAAVGCLIGAWIQSGTVPTLIYYGLSFISPSIFLPATMLLCSILSLCTGTSYGSAASAGLACMGIGLSMGFPAGPIAGAVICGALFGDKMSPFSDTTNLAPAMAGTDLFTHIRSMLWTTVPAWIISIIAFYVIGLKYAVNTFDQSQIITYMNGLASNFNLSAVTLLPAVIVLILLLLKISAFPTIMLGAAFGGITAMLTQGKVFTDVITVMLKGYSIKSGILLVDKLLNRGGLASMYGIITIMIFAMGLGGMLERMGILSNFLNAFVKKIRSVKSLVFCTMIVSYLSGAIGCTQSMSHVLTGKLLAPVYKEKGVAPEVLSRTMEDCGTLGGAMIPWHTNAIYFCGALSVAFDQYLPFLFLCYIVPCFSLFYAGSGIAIWYVDPVTGERIPKEKAPINQE